jgi:hypothetical protein
MILALTAYAAIASLQLMIALSSTLPPRSTFWIAAGALLWPLALAAVAAHVYVVEPVRRRMSSRPSSGDALSAHVCLHQPPHLG